MPSPNRSPLALQPLDLQQPHQRLRSQLQNILHLTLPQAPPQQVPARMAQPERTPTDSSTVVLALAVIRSYPIVEKHPALDIHYFTAAGALEVVDLATVECLVGRFKVEKGGQKGAIIDRSGSLARSVYFDDDEDEGEL